MLFIRTLSSTIHLLQIRFVKNDFHLYIFWHKDTINLPSSQKKWSNNSSIRILPLLQGKSPKGDGYNIKNIVFKALRPRNAPKTLFLKLCGLRFVPFRGLNDLSRPRFIPLRGLNDPLRPRVAPLRGLNAHCDLALCQNHPTISSPVARKAWKMRESA